MSIAGRTILREFWAQACNRCSHPSASTGVLDPERVLSRRLGHHDGGGRYPMRILGDSAILLGGSFPKLHVMVGGVIITMRHTSCEDLHAARLRSSAPSPR
jgi:hypothetical protein